MSRSALSLSLTLLVMASTAFAEDTRSLGVTVSPVGAFVASNTAHGVVGGYSAAIGWEFYKAPATISAAGHIASSTILTDATPISLRWTPRAGQTVRPYVGVGPSFVIAHDLDEDPRASSRALLRLGGEVAAGVSIDLSDAAFAQFEGRYQSFSVTPYVFSPERQDLLSACIGIGFRL
jgi:outer membrane protein W